MCVYIYTCMCFLSSSDYSIIPCWEKREDSCICEPLINFTDLFANMLLAKLMKRN